MIRLLRVAPALAAAFVGACARPAPSPAASPQLPMGAEARSFLGEPLYAPQLAADKRAARERDLAAARTLEPEGSVERAIWVGRRLADLGGFQEAIATFTEAIGRHPNDPRLLRHRGHRFITVRQLDRAIADLERAATLIERTPDEVEPDGQPNARNTPIGTLHGNVWYHLALAHYLARNDAESLRAWRAGAPRDGNPDRVVSTSYWTYLTLLRLGRAGEAREVLDAIRADFDIVENHSYHELLLTFRGEREADAVLAKARTSKDGVAFPTVAYGIGAWRLHQGDPRGADALFREILAGGNWPAFGFIAAEAEVAYSARANQRSQPK
jgi:tetratricopeptide (TPR) repeat protein